MTKDQLLEGYRILKDKGVKIFGIHAFSMGYQYNAKFRSAEILYQEDGTRRAEKPEDYFATVDGFDF